MRTKKPLTLSIVIPAYNEERYLGRCLAAIAAQTDMPDEVIVVDNNSSDATVAVAQRFPFVRVVHEPRQGVVYARDAGFNAARSEIIGRIDADTMLEPDWVLQVRARFAQDADLPAITGSVHYYDVPWRPLVSWVDLLCRRYLAKCLGRELYLYGANMAMRRSVWLGLRDQLCHERQLHEDFDLAVHLSRQQGAAAQFEPSLHAGVSARRVDTPLRSFYDYAAASPRTYAAHGLRSQRPMYHVIAFLLLIHWFLRLGFRASDSQTGRFSPHRIATISERREQRLSPVAE